MVARPQHPAVTTFGDFFRALREKKRFTQDELAVRAGVSRSTIQNLEKSDALSGRPYSLKAVAKALDMTVDELEAGWRESASVDIISSNGHKIEHGADEQVMRREIDGFSRVLKGDALQRLWELAREECKAQL